jgi:hypothetical protein
MVAHLEALFPGLQHSVYHVTSPADDVYNCIAWAASDKSRWWWPDTGAHRYWPAGLLRDESLSAFQAALASLGYSVCTGEDLEAGFEKVALFADVAGFPTHAARQLPNGRWTSKLGELEDIERALHALEGVEYGLATVIMKRVSANP